MKKQIILFTLILSVTNAQEFGVLTTKGKTYKGELLALDTTGIKLKIEYGQIEIPATDILSVRFPSFFNRADSISNEISRAADSLLKFYETYIIGESKNIPLSDKTTDTKERVKFKFIPYDDPPKPLSPIRPKYPKYAKENRIEGTVIVQVFVDKNGRVTETSILKGIPNSGLDEAAIDAIKSTNFKPARQRYKPVGVWISIPVNFRLK